MPKTPSSLRARLKKAGIQHFDELIHDQSASWLIQHFSKGKKKKYPLNVSLLIRNIIWQLRERIRRGEREPLRELVRTFWYMFIKPTLARSGSLSSKTDQYNSLIDQFVYMVKTINVIDYRDIGFRDEAESHRVIGGNSNIILFAEKLGFSTFLTEMHNKFDITTIALGGQPSLLTAEYFVDSMRERNINLRRSFYLLNIVDYDPSGWIIKDAFLSNLKFLGIPNTRMINLITPDILTEQELKHSRFPLKNKKETKKINQDWHERIKQENYQNQRFLERTRITTGKRALTLFGLESEATSTLRLEKALQAHLEPLLGKSERFLKNFEIRKLDILIKDLIVSKLT